MKMKTETERTILKRGAKRACYHPAEIHHILDSHLLCHVGFVIKGEARVIPTAYVRIGEAIYLHGNRRNHMLRALLAGQTACVTVTELNGLVLGRSGLHHSANYRSVVMFARAEAIEDRNEKVAVLNGLIDHMVPDRSSQIRPHSEQELAATLVVKLNIEEASAKIRRGPPVDVEQDYQLGTWAGVLELKTVVADVQACPRLPAHIEVPEQVAEFARAKGWSSSDVLS